MKIIKLIFLLVFIILSNGCSKYQIKPTLEPFKTKQTIQINSFSFHINKEYYKNDFFDITKEILPSSILLNSAPQNCIEQDEDYYHMDIDIKYFSGGASGIDYLSALSLWLIPTWETKKGVFKYKFDLYKNGSLYKINNYVIDLKMYSHILLLPLGVINLIISDDYTDFYKEAIRTNVKIYNKNEETNNFP